MGPARVIACGSHFEAATLCAASRATITPGVATQFRATIELGQIAEKLRARVKVEYHAVPSHEEAVIIDIVAKSLGPHADWFRDVWVFVTRCCWCSRGFLGPFGWLSAQYCGGGCSVCVSRIAHWRKGFGRQPPAGTCRRDCLASATSELAVSLMVPAQSRVIAPACGTTSDGRLPATRAGGPWLPSAARSGVGRWRRASPR
jgi:hypothetical protein